MNPVIEVQGLTKDYGQGRGVFDLTFQVEKGEVFGFLGPNGAGKTTTIRQLMGFVRPTRGGARILGKDCFRQAAAIQAHTGYLPGELSLMDDLTGDGFLRFMAQMRGMKGLGSAEELKELFRLDGRQSLRKMSKGTRQKVGLVCAFMAQPELLLLDEPTSGLDPLMQNRFIELLLREKARGATILLSSHMFEELERTCDRVAILRAGHLAAVEPIAALRQTRTKQYQFTFPSPASAAAFSAAWPGAKVEGSSASVALTGQEELSRLLSLVAGYDVKDMSVDGGSLEDAFLGYYGEEV